MSEETLCGKATFLVVYSVTVNLPIDTRIPCLNKLEISDLSKLFYYQSSEELGCALFDNVGYKSYACLLQLSVVNPNLKTVADDSLLERLKILPAKKARSRQSIQPGTFFDQAKALIEYHLPELGKASALTGEKFLHSLQRIGGNRVHRQH